MLDIELIVYTILFFVFAISKAHKVSLKVSWLWGVRCYWWLFACSGVCLFFYIHRLIKRAQEKRIEKEEEANKLKVEGKVEEGSIEEGGKDT